MFFQNFPNIPSLQKTIKKPILSKIMVKLVTNAELFNNLREKLYKNLQKKS